MRFSLALALAGTLLTSPFSAEAQGDAQRHILDAGINLGWAAGIVATDGRVTAANAAEVGEDLARARAHVAAFRAQVSDPPYHPERFAAIERQIDELARRIGALEPGEATRELGLIRRHFRDALRVFLSARTGRLEQTGTCDSATLEVGFLFGQGHTAIQRGNVSLERSARGAMTRAIADGEASAQRLACPFAGATFRALPMMSSQTPDTYRVSLPRIQAAVPTTTPATTPANATRPANEGVPLPGRWSGWGRIELRPTPNGLEGTYSDTYSRTPGGIVLVRSGGRWTGTWEEARIGRRGRLLEVHVSPDGRRIHGRYDITETGGRRQYGVREFEWTYAGE
ncbi:MAG: hypothetical protein H6720_07015 [Sandaracinus sp.]|nr:hypothetical protein [Sandaracinus sp.]